MKSNSLKAPAAKHRSHPSHRNATESVHNLRMDLDKLLGLTMFDANKIDAVYERHFTKQSFSTPRVKSRPHFDRNQYPRIPAGYLEQEIRDGEIPIWDCPADLLKMAAQDSPLARLLAAYVWKRGELGRVLHLRDGMDSSETCEHRNAASQTSVDGDDVEAESASVMWQFGRHLSDQDKHPIVDQHTYRAFLVLDGHGYLRSDTTALSRSDVERYRTWWNGLATRAPRDKLERRDALHALDRLLFSFGKAVLLSPGSFRRERKRKGKADARPSPQPLIR